MRFAVFFVVAASTVLCACAAPADEPERPAVLIAPSAKSREELQLAISHALYGERAGAPIVLADDALTTTDLLVIDRTPVRDTAGRLLNGRELGRPEHFNLVMRGTHCTLVHERTGQRFTLPAATCKAMK